ncbi:glycosyltransferase WbuB [Paraburkholderia sp. DHOC27]|uniref:glycosyltransferase WbuB n=1 Tax=Paraburkholderia sp. DHOC27 TaxID=2303330 RepID=UPI000E3C41DD|nr:glycosyltransferase WbuB [Paraburkholderia sp. DHOC27]RFU48113.1 colanic acid biosynthesis glycosyltransferase WcaI [Paraburkholderia sp. DHOC27]
MKILIVGLNYAPELTGVGKYTAEMADALASEGHDVRVVCGPPYYPQWRIAEGYSGWRYRAERRGAVRVLRVPLWVPAKPTGASRLLHLASYAVSAMPVLMAQLVWRADVVMSIAPSLMSAPGAWLVARLSGAKSWLHIQDYEVDAAFDLGVIEGKRSRRVALAVERSLLKRFDVVSSLSSKMVERALAKGVDARRTYCLPNWVDTRAIVPLAHAQHYRKLLGLDSDANPQTVVLYSGNMGSKQGLEIVVAAAVQLARRTDISFVFCGSGPMREQLEARCAGSPNCRFISLQPVHQLNQLLNLADIHVLPQRGGAADLVMPSKLGGMLASGRAVIAMACAGTELYDVVATRGVAVPPENVGALVEAIEALAADPVRRAALGAAGREYAERSLSSVSVFAALNAKLAQLCGNDAVVARSASVPSTMNGGVSHEKLAETPLESTQVD